MERTGAGYFDFYLLHALTRTNYKKYDDYHIWDFVKELKSKGLIKHFGFSFHADSNLLEELLTLHPDVDFIQLQINYADWENPDIESRNCYEIALKHKVPITIMEPIKGGSLANPISPVKNIFDKANEKLNQNLSYASWAIRFAASLDGIITVLSGMSNLEQVEDNISYMKNFVPLSDYEKSVIKEVQTILSDNTLIPCTACHYCTDGCPKQIPIPEIFDIKNKMQTHSLSDCKKDYISVTKNRGKASDCIKCKKCENSCPQHLKIIEFLKECRIFEE